MKKILFLIRCNLLFITQSFASAQPKQWQIISDQSKIEFATNSGNSKVEGGFGKFSGLIYFDKNNLPNSKIAIDIDLNSVKSSFYGAVDRLKTNNWFDIKTFPIAKFTSTKFSATNNNQFHCDGFLELKGKKLPIALDFAFSEYSESKAVATGSAAIDRNAFGLGGSDDQSKTIDNLVAVKFLITAQAK